MRGCLCDPRVHTCVIIAITHTHTHTLFFCCCTEERFYSPVHLIHCCMVLKLFTQYSSLYVLTTRMCGILVERTKKKEKGKVFGAEGKREKYYFVLREMQIFF